jgi:DNA helicase II / ATP-dependent DNA helicase PcrA
VISLATERFTKDLWSGRTSSDRPRLVTVTDEAEQARYVAHRVLENRERGSALKAQAVLFRASNHSPRSRSSLRCAAFLSSNSAG